MTRKFTYDGNDELDKLFPV